MAKPLSTGKIIAAYTADAESSEIRIARFNPDGSADATFTPYLFPEAEFGFGLSVTADDYILINRRKETGQQATLMVLLDTAGTEVSAFAGLHAADNTAGHFTLQDCQSLLCYGVYNRMDGINKNSLVRYNLADIVQAPTGELYQQFTNGQVLNDLDVTGQNILWFDQQGGCSINADRNPGTVNAALPGTTPLVDGTTYFASQTIGGIESNYRLPVTVEQLLGVSGNAFENFKVWPNPAGDVLHLSSKEIIDSVTIFNIIGQQVAHVALRNKQADVDLSELQSGIYMVKLDSENQSQTIKVVKR